MSAPAFSARPVAPLLSWRRVRAVLLVSGVFGILLGFGWGFFPIVLQAIALGLVVMLVFGLFERWPRRLPRGLARWVLQVVAAGLVVPFANALLFWLTTPDGAPAWYSVQDRMNHYSSLTGLGVLVAPWAALSALVRQKDALAREQALAFDLEKSELERQALDARLRLLQAQVAPHFLFNTLANVQALVDAGSPQAATVLRSLVAYLRASVPRLDEASTTIGRELELVTAYLDLMHMRMPDRLSFTLACDDAARGLACPPMTLLTLVENAVRHGIDPSEEGGAIALTVRREDGRCRVRVRDTGAGLASSAAGLGTGLATLRERLALTFQGDATLAIRAGDDRGVVADLDFPAREASA